MCAQPSLLRSRAEQVGDRGRRGRRHAAAHAPAGAGEQPGGVGVPACALQSEFLWLHGLSTQACERFPRPTHALLLQLAVGLRAMPHEATAAGLQMAAVNLAQRVA